jgi:DNA-binding transcriptional LysR family regulator
MYDLSQVRVLQEVAARGSFSAAAEALDYTQSAVSKQIAALERQIGLTLVERAVRPCQLTDAGETLLKHAEQAFSHTSRQRTSIWRSRTCSISDSLTSGWRTWKSLTAGTTIVAPALAKVPSRSVPARRPAIASSSCSAAAARARRGARPRGDRHHPLARRRTVKLAELAGERWLFPRITGGTASTYDRLMRGACAVAGFEPRILFEINDCQTAQGFVAAGLGIAVLPHLALHPVHPGVAARKLHGAPKRSVLAIRLRASAPTPTATAGLQCLRAAAQRAARPLSVPAGPDGSP